MPEIQQIRRAHPIYRGIQDKLEHLLTDTTPNDIMPRKIKGLRCLFPLKPNRLLFQWSRVSNKRLFKKWSRFGWNKLSLLRVGRVWVKLPKPKALIIFLEGNLRLRSTSAFTTVKALDAFQVLVNFALYDSLVLYKSMIAGSLEVRSNSHLISCIRW